MCLSVVFSLSQPTRTTTAETALPPVHSSVFRTALLPGPHSTRLCFPHLRPTPSLSATIPWTSCPPASFNPCPQHCLNPIKNLALFLDSACTQQSLVHKIEEMLELSDTSHPVAWHKLSCRAMWHLGNSHDVSLMLSIFKRCLPLGQEDLCSH